VGKMFVSEPTLRSALQRLYGTAGHLLKIWLTLKHMGLAEDRPPVEIDTANSTASLKRLFGCGSQNGDFYVPFAHTKRMVTMKSDASRSIIQTNIQRWATSGSVVTCDPTEFLSIDNSDGNGPLLVSTSRRYPLGLGFGESGFALQNGARVAIPIIAFAVWYGRQTSIPDSENASEFLVRDMLEDLHISQTEKEAVFVDDTFSVKTSPSKLSDAKVFSICAPFIDGTDGTPTEIVAETNQNYARRIRSMVSGLDIPAWMRQSPEAAMADLMSGEAKAILLYGPPRTGKTRAIDAVCKRADPKRSTIQIHDGWGYDNLIEGFRPNEKGEWHWEPGPLFNAIADGKKLIVLEEINRTAISQALGEVFSLIEDAYRGEENAIILRSGKKFSIPKDVVFIMTMNTIDKSTEEVDDALMGRVAAVEFPPRAEDLEAMLASNKVPENIRKKLSELFTEIQNLYPIGHGYFSGLKSGVDPAKVLSYYKARVRPVLLNFLGELKRQELSKIDNLVDQFFNAK
jgi:5-methylcytosine-specific restriction enzyme B